MIEITTKGLRSVHSNISLKEKRIGIPFRIVHQLYGYGNSTLILREEKKNYLNYYSEYGLMSNRKIRRLLRRGRSLLINLISSF